MEEISHEYNKLILHNCIIKTEDYPPFIHQTLRFLALKRDFSVILGATRNYFGVFCIFLE